MADFLAFAFFSSTSLTVLTCVPCVPSVWPGELTSLSLTLPLDLGPEHRITLYTVCYSVAEVKGPVSHLKRGFVSTSCLVHEE